MSKSHLVCLPHSESGPDFTILASAWWQERNLHNEFLLVLLCIRGDAFGF